MRRPFWSWTDLFRALGVRVQWKPRRRGQDRYCRSLRTESLETRVYLSGEGLGDEPAWPEPLVVAPALVAAEQPGKASGATLESVLVPSLQVPGPNSPATTDLSSDLSADPTEPPVRLPVASARDVAVVEGEDAVFDIVLSGPSAEPVSVRYWTGNGTAEHPRGDFARREGAVVFAPGETLRRVTIPTGDDALEEGDEHFWLFLTRPRGVELGDRVASGTIVDNDRVPYVDVSSPRVTEGQTAWFIVSLSNPYTKPVRVVATAEGITAEAGKDFAPRRVTLTFEPGQTIQRVAVPTYFQLRPMPSAEPRRFSLVLSSPEEAELRTAEATCMIAPASLMSGGAAGKTTAEELFARSGKYGMDLDLLSYFPTLSVSDASGAEGTSIEFAVSLSSAAESDLAVHWFAISGTAIRRRKTIIYRIWDVSVGDGFRSSNHLETRCGGCGLQRVRRRSLCDLWGIFAHPAKHEPPSLPSSASLRSGSQRSRAFRAGYLASCG